jgi:hypothetical protein
MLMKGVCHTIFQGLLAKTKDDVHNPVSIWSNVRRHPEQFMNGRTQL